MGMKTTFKNRIQKLIAGILVISAGLLILNNVVFLHTHKLPDGSIIVHAHPYSKSQDSEPFKKHNHSSKELFHISHIQLLFIAAIFSFLYLEFIQQKFIFLYRNPFTKFNYSFRSKGRDPPFLLH